MKYISLDDIINKLEEETFISSLFDGKNISIAVQYESKFPNAKVLREFVDEIAKHANIEPKWRTRLVLIVDELNNNAIEYGSKENDTNILKIEMTSLWDNLDVVISVTDAGTWAHCKSAQDMRELQRQHLDKDYSNHHSIRWRWLFLIISQLVDTLDFADEESGGLIVKFVKKLPVGK